MYGIGILKGLGVTFKHFVETYTDDIKWLGRKHDADVFQYKQSLSNKGMVTVEYPDEKLAVPERFRFVPFLLTYNNDDPEYPGKDWCTSCGICAKVCPPQCIWIVRGTNPETGRPKPEPEAFFIDIDICMNCGYCAEYCPFDAIKMDHDYELASYDRTTNHIHDKQHLSKEVRYWETIAPTTAAEEMAARGGYDHTDVQKNRKKAGLPASRPGPTSDKAPAQAPALVAAAQTVTTEVPPDRPSVAQGQQSAATPAAAERASVTADGKPIVRRRGAAKPAGEAGAAPSLAAPTPAAPAASAASPAVAAEAPAKQAVPAAAAAPATPAASTAPAVSGGVIQRGPKRVIDPNNPPPPVHRTRLPPEGK